MRMVYFRTNYKHVAYPPPDEVGGLYNAQIGAIHQIASHFTIHDDPAVVTMPTGSGKTAVLMMSPFVLRSSRVLVITPSRLVREQISDDFRSLETLRKANVIPSPVPSPRVFELKERVDSDSRWEALRQFDVVVATPNVASPAYQNIPPPPTDLFDLILIDEAHHTPAKTWRELLLALSHVRTVLFTATPFRRDRSEIPGRFVYSYPLARAYSDKIFGQITYVPVEVPDGVASDVAIATAADQVFQADRAAGFTHYLMVRTDRVARATELAVIYAQHTALKLEAINNNLSSKRVRKILDDLAAGHLDGIICVNMLGEGFNFPRLKIAAIHAPHKSLENTLQFIGRFARTNAQDIGPAKFVGVRSEMEIEGERLFEEGAVWQDIIIGLSQDKIADEVNTREVLENFEKRETLNDDLSDLSLYSLYPRPHVKIYAVQETPDLKAEIAFEQGIRIAFRSLNEDGNTLVLLTQEAARPKWSDSDRILETSSELLVVYHDEKSHLLFISCSHTIDAFYEAIALAVSPEAAELPTSLVRRVVKGIVNPRVFNLGMRNIQATNRAESYRITAGSDTQATIKPSDARMYRQGHAFLTGEAEGAKVNIGYSSRSKVWASMQLQIPHLVAWCKQLGERIRSTGDIVTHSGLDLVSAGAVADKIPADVVYVRWDADAFGFSNPVQVQYKRSDGTTATKHILDLDLKIDAAKTDESRIRVDVVGDGLEYPIEFTMEEFFSAVNGDDERVQVIRGATATSLIDYLNTFYPEFFTASGSLFTGNEFFAANPGAPPIGTNQLVVWSWEGVEIENETVSVNGGLTVHERVRKELEAGDEDIIIYDHGTGELADFITLKKGDDAVFTRLYHCKGSGAAVPGARVDDLYEVCGQAQKSIAWTNLERLYNRIGQRKKAQFLRGAFNDLTALIEQGKTLGKRFEVVVVQPGVSRAKLSAAMSENLGATNDHVVGAGCEPIRAVVSA
jgi:superfamily II DNA or RNA helicase